MLYSCKQENENKQCECYHFTYTVFTVRMGVVLYGRTSYVNDNILTFLRFSRNDYYSICLDYCNSSNFEQIIKAPHYALPSYVVFYRNLYGSTHFCGSHFLFLLYIHFFVLSNIALQFNSIREMNKKLNDVSFRKKLH